MFYRLILVIGIVLVTIPCSASPSLRFMQVMTIELARMQLPYAEKIAADTLNAEQLKKFDTITRIYDDLNISLQMYKEMEAIKLQASGEASELNAFATKFFVAMLKNVHVRDISHSPYFRLVDRYKHLLAEKYIEKIDVLAAEMLEISSKDFFIGEITEAEGFAHHLLEDRYISHVFTGLKEAGAIDLKSIASTELEKKQEEITKKIGIDNSDPNGTHETLEFLTPFYSINQLKILRQQDLGALGETNFQISAQSDYGFSRQEIYNLQHILDLQNKYEHLVLDYFADNIKQTEFVDKIDNLLTAYGEVLSDASKHEIGKRLAELR